MKRKNTRFRLHQHKAVLFILGWLAVAPLTSSSLVTVYLFDNEAWLASFELWQWLVFFAISIFTMALALTPTTYIAIVTGYFLGLEGCWLVILSYQIASVIGYFISSKLNEGFADELIKSYPKAEGMLSRVSQNDFWVAVLSRLSPALPFAMMNVVLAVAKVRFTHFFFGGLIGMLPRTLFFIWVGSQAAYLRHAMTENEGLIWILGLTAIVFAAFYFLLRPISPKNP